MEEKKVVLVKNSIILFILSFIICINNVEAKTISEVNIGDYIKMTPTSTEYMPPSDLTGCLNDTDCTQNIINPSELNLWRVIRKNEDGTVDVVSEYVSSTEVFFLGETGYLNLVGALNTIAAHYTNEKYVSKTRHMGYNNQTLNCPALSGCKEDFEYERDIDLIISSIGTLVGKTLSGKNTRYWVASRYSFGSTTLYYGYHIRGVIDKGSVTTYCLWDKNNSNSLIGQYSFEGAIRPILTLKADIVLPIPSDNGTNDAVLYDLDNPIYSEENEEIDSDKEEINDIKFSTNEIENPNTGNFLFCILILSIVVLTIIILNISKARKIFKI